MPGTVGRRPEKIVPHAGEQMIPWDATDVNGTPAWSKTLFLQGNRKLPRSRLRHRHDALYQVGKVHASAPVLHRALWRPPITIPVTPGSRKSFRTCSVAHATMSWTFPGRAKWDNPAETLPDTHAPAPRAVECYDTPDEYRLGGTWRGNAHTP